MNPTRTDPTNNRPPIPSAPPDVPGYDIGELIGRGGMGDVYRARDLELDREVAVKLLQDRYPADSPTAARFIAEARITGQLQHPGIPAVYRVATLADGRPFLAMKLIKGRTLDELLQDGDTVSHLAVIEAIAQAVGYAHAHGVIHRDLKPANVMVGAFGEVQVMDWGLAKLLAAGGGPGWPEADPEATIAPTEIRTGRESDHTQAGSVLGTPGYMPPEQAAGETHRVGPASDVFGLGAVWCKLLTGRPPFAGTDAESVRRNALRGKTEEALARLGACGADPGAVALCRQCLAVEPEDRPADANAVVAAVAALRVAAEERAKQAELAKARAEVRAGEQAKRRRVVQWSAAAVAAVLLVGLAGTGLGLWRADLARRAAEVAERDADARRVAAEAAEVREAEARAMAVRAEADARQRLIRLYVATGATAQDAGDPGTALLWYQRAREQDAADPAAEAAHRDRLGGTLAELPELLGACFHADRVCDAAFSPAGDRVLARTDGDEAILWDYAASTPAAPPLRHAGRVRHACYHPDGKEVATASADGTAGVWGAATGARRLTLRHTGPLTWVEFHPDGRRLLTAGEDGAVRLWDVATGRPLDWRLPTDVVQECAAFSPDGKRLVTAGRDNTARVWEVDPPKPASPPLPHRAPTATERYVYNYQRWPRFGPDGRTVVAFDGSLLTVWADGVPPRPVPVPLPVIEVNFIPGSGRVLVTGSGGKAAVVELADGKLVHTLPHPRNANIGTASPDGRWLLTCSSGGPVHLWEAATGNPVYPPQRCGDFCSAVAFSRDGAKYLAASQDGTVRVWAAGRRRPAERPYSPADGWANVAPFKAEAAGGRFRMYSPDGRRWVEADAAGLLALADRAGGPVRPVPHPHPADAAKWCYDGSRFLVSGGGVVRAWAADGTPAGPDLPVAAPENRLQEFHLSRDGTRLVAWDDEQTLSVWDTATGRRVFGPARHPDPGPVIFEKPSQAGWVRAAALSPDGQSLAVGIESSGTLTVWDMVAGTIRHHHRRFRGYLYVLKFTDYGDRVLVYSSDNIARLYDAATGQRAGPPIRQPIADRACDVTPDGRRLVVVDALADAARVWDVARGERLLSLPLAGRRQDFLWFAPDGRAVNGYFRDRMPTFPLPRLDLPAADAGRLVRFLTGQQIDDTDGVEFVDQFAFRSDPDGHRRLWRRWRGLPE